MCVPDYPLAVPDFAKSVPNPVPHRAATSPTEVFAMPHEGTREGRGMVKTWDKT